MLVSQTDYLIAERLKLKKKVGRKSAIEPIDENELNLFYNSINIAIGKQGNGKTLLFLRELINISALEEEFKDSPNPLGFHLIFYVNQSGEINDETFKILQDLISIPIVVINYDQAEDTITGLLDYKQEYYKLIDQPDLIGQWDNEKINVISEALAIDIKKTKNKPKTLHTIIYFEDSANQSIFKRNDSFFNKIAFACRHNNTIFLFCVQKMAGISKPILSQVTSVFIYPGYSPQELSYIHRMSAISGLDYHELKSVYKALKQYNLLNVNTVTQNFKIIDLSHISKLVNSKRGKIRV